MSFECARNARARMFAQQSGQAFKRGNRKLYEYRHNMNDPTNRPQKEADASSQPASTSAKDVSFQSFDKKPWEQADWSSLVTSISQHNVIPVIGPELLTIEVSGQQVPLYQHVADCLAERLGLPRPPVAVEALHELVRHYKHQGSPPSSLLPELCDVMAAIKAPPSPALQHLAEIRGFKLFVSTTPDRLLEDAINSVRFRGQNIVTSLEYSLNSRADLPQTVDELSDLANISPPLVFHLFGMLSPLTNSCALTEEDLLEFFYDFRKHETKMEKLLNVVRNRQLLFLGTTWPDWYNRFFLRNAHSPRLTQKEQIDYLVGDCFAGEQAFVSFLQDFTRTNTTRVLAVDPAVFVSALRDHWLERFKPDPLEPIPLPENMGHNSLFISYAHEDAEEVERLRVGLEEAELDVWFDRKQLTTGADWQQKIETNLKTCLYFLPVVSKNTEAAVFNRYFREEWKQAVEIARRSHRSFEFILPIKLDSGPHEKVPERFGDKNWTLLPGGQVTPEFVDHIKALVSKRIVERHDR